MKLHKIDNSGKNNDIDCKHDEAHVLCTRWPMPVVSTTDSNSKVNCETCLRIVNGLKKRLPRLPDDSEVRMFHNIYRGEIKVKPVWKPVNPCNECVCDKDKHSYRLCGSCAQGQIYKGIISAQRNLLQYLWATDKIKLIELKLMLSDLEGK